MDYLLLLAQIIIINIVLSGDNAVVIAMASKNLPEDKRKKAVWWGAFGAVFFRIILTIVAVYLLQIPFIQAVGALLLLYIAMKLLDDNQREHKVNQAYSMGSAVTTIILADAIMSLDNVLAVAAIVKENYLMLFIGIAMSIPLIVWGSHYMVHILSRYPILIYLGAAILGFTAGEMFLSEETLQSLFKQVHTSVYWVIPIFFTGAVLISGMYRPRIRK